MNRWPFPILLFVVIVAGLPVRAARAQDTPEGCRALELVMARLDGEEERLSAVRAPEAVTYPETDAFFSDVRAFLEVFSARTLLHQIYLSDCGPRHISALAAPEGARPAEIAPTTNTANGGAAGPGVLAVPLPDDLSWSGGWALGWSSSCDLERSVIQRPWHVGYEVAPGCLRFMIDDTGRVVFADFPVPPTGGIFCQRFARFDGQTLHYRGSYEGDIEVKATIQVTGPLEGVYLPVHITGTFDAYAITTGEPIGTGAFDLTAYLERRSISETLEAESICGGVE